jgi:hypothetical protein
MINSVETINAKPLKKRYRVTRRIYDIPTIKRIQLMAAEGYSKVDIAKMFYVDEKTIRNYLKMDLKDCEQQGCGK